MKKLIVAVCMTVISVPAFANPPGGGSGGGIKKQGRSGGFGGGGISISFGGPVKKQEHVYTVSPAREKWIMQRIPILQQRVDDCEAAEVSAYLGLVPTGQTMSDAGAAIKHQVMKRQCKVDKFELKALQRELAIRMRQRSEG